MKKRTMRTNVIAAKKPKVCTGRDLAAALAEVKLPESEAKAWRRDLIIARRVLKAPINQRGCWTKDS